MMGEERCTGELGAQVSNERVECSRVDDGLSLVVFAEHNLRRLQRLVVPNAHIPVAADVLRDP